VKLQEENGYSKCHPLSWGDRKLLQYAGVGPGALGLVPPADRYFYVALLLIVVSLIKGRYNSPACKVPGS